MSEPQYPCGFDTDFKVSNETSPDTLKNAVSANDDAAPIRLDTLKAEHESAQALIQYAAVGLASLKMSTIGVVARAEELPSTIHNATVQAGNLM